MNLSEFTDEWITNNKSSSSECITTMTPNTSVKFTVYPLVYLSFSASIVATVSNTVILYTIYKLPSLQTSSNLLIKFLAITDLLTGVLVLPIFMLICLGDTTKHNDCSLRVFHNCLSHILCGNGVFLIAVISLDRCIKVAFPLKCRTWDLKLAYRLTALFGLLFMALIVTLYVVKVISHTEFRTLVSVFIVGVMLTAVTSYVIIYSFTRKSNRTVSHMTTRGLHRIKQKREVRAAKVIGVILLVLVACYIPRLISVITYKVHPDYKLVSYHLSRWSAFFVFLNAALNPLIYCSGVAEFRFGAMMVISKLASLFK